MISTENPEKFKGIEAREKENNKFGDLVIFTTTFYGEDEISRVRADLAEKLFENANSLGVKVVVIDGGSNPEFLEKIRQFENVKLVINPNFGIGESRRAALQEAINLASTEAGNSYYLWTEPEKCGLITEENLTTMIEKLRERKTDIVVPKRKSFDSLPSFQAWTEKRANKRIAEKVLKKAESDTPTEELDLFFGPKMFNREGAKYFLEYQGKLDKWDATIKPVIEAFHDGKSVASIAVDFTYEESQRGQEEEDEDFKRKRVEQYLKILAEVGDKYWQEKLNKDK